MTPQSPILNRQSPLIAIAVSFLLMGCSQPATSTPPKPAPVSVQTFRRSVETFRRNVSTQVETPSPQELPISAKAEIAGQTFELEVATTPEQQAMGLMFRPSLPDNRGMLFSFSPPRPVTFWMKNTIIPLDMIFLRDGEVKYIAENVPTCTDVPPTDVPPTDVPPEVETFRRNVSTSCPTYGPPGQIAIDQVIELRAGRAGELGLKTGNRISIEFLDQQKPASPQ